MRAAIVTREGVAIAKVPRPQPGPEDVLIRVRAASLNRADLIVAAGGKHGTLGGPGTVLGLDCAGEVAAVGEKVRAFAPGQRVAASCAGGLAEYAVADCGRVLALPEDRLAWEEAASLPVALATMHDALVTQGGLREGMAVLVLGASSGVGLMGMQIAKLLGASIVIGTSTAAEKRARLNHYGADVALDTTDPTWPEAVLQASNGRGVDLVIDHIGAATIEGAMRCTALGGRIINVGRLGGAHGSFDFDLHALRRITYIGVTHRTRSREEIRAEYAAMQRDLWAAACAGQLRIPLDRICSLDELPAALDTMRANQHFGKIVIALSPAG